MGYGTDNSGARKVEVSRQNLLLGLGRVANVKSILGRRPPQEPMAQLGCSAYRFDRGQPTFTASASVA
jgi:hypothetical protein